MNKIKFQYCYLPVSVFTQTQQVGILAFTGRLCREESLPSLALLVFIFQMVLPKLQLMELIKLEIVTSELRHATVETNNAAVAFPVSNFSFINIANIYLQNVAVTTTQVQKGYNRN